MKIIVNGIAIYVSAGKTIAGFIAQKGLNRAAIVVEHNYEIVKQEQYDTVVLNQDDKLEIVTFVGGG